MSRIQTIALVLSLTLVSGRVRAAEVCQGIPDFPPPPGFTWVCGSDGKPQLAKVAAFWDKERTQTFKGELFAFHVNSVDATLSLSEDGTRVVMDQLWSCHAEGDHIVCTRPKP